MSLDLRQGDSLLLLPTLPDNSVDAVVCDPPYEIGLIGKPWDKSGIAYSVPLWREVFRVLKPGGHLLAFSASRTYHRMACAIEDAGFEIRNQIMWIFGSGFPKGKNATRKTPNCEVCQRPSRNVTEQRQMNRIGLCLDCNPAKGRLKRYPVRLRAEDETTTATGREKS